MHYIGIAAIINRDHVSVLINNSDKKANIYVSAIKSLPIPIPCLSLMTTKGEELCLDTVSIVYLKLYVSFSRLIDFIRTLCHTKI